MSGEARREVEAAVRRIVTGAGGTMVRRQGSRRAGRDWTIEEPDPLPAIRAAASLQSEAGHAIARAARYAREDGLTWEQIGTALYPADPDPDEEPRAVRAFSRLAYAYDSFDSPRFNWTCPDCLRGISDYGPETDHPADAERGHACDCARLARAVADYDARWEEDEDQWDDG